MILSINEPDFWEARYQQGTTGWDLGEPAPPFVDFYWGQFQVSK